MEDYISCVKDLLADKNVQRLKEFSHHKGTSRFQHSLNVSYYNYKLCRFLHLNAKAGARAGLLHDLFFYDWRGHEPVEGEGWHGVGHPKVAFFTASELFPITQLEGDMIATHMWPLSPGLPRYRESYVITLVDKFCAVAEVLSHFFHVSAEALLRFCRKSRTRFDMAHAAALLLVVRMLHR